MMKRRKKSAGAAAGKKRIRKVVRKAPLRKGVKGKRKTGRLAARKRSVNIPVAPTAAAYNQAFDAGFDEAYNDGFNVGYAEGMEAGHQEAYKGA